MGLTTATASVVPAPSPAVLFPTELRRVVVIRIEYENAHTDEYPTNASCSCLSIREPRLVRLKTRETDGHFGDDPGKDCTEAFIQSERGFSADYHRASSYKATRLRLMSVDDGLGAGGQNRFTIGLTPGRRPDLDSCIRTLMVSRG
jgi:hypothetical protein